MDTFSHRLHSIARWTLGVRLHNPVWQSAIVPYVGQAVSWSDASFPSPLRPRKPLVDGRGEEMTLEREVAWLVHFIKATGCIGYQGDREAFPIFQSIHFKFLPAAKPAGQWIIIGVPLLPVKFCEWSSIRARKTLEPRLLMPLSSNLMSEVIQALRNRTHLSQYGTKEAKEALRLRLFRPLHSLSMTDAD